MSRLRSATTRAGRSQVPTRGGCLATRGAMPMRCCARAWKSSVARLGGTYRVLVDSNDHVDREAAVRAGVAFYGKNTMAITRRFGSWVVLGTLVTDVEIESNEPLALDCGSCRLCIDACPTGALDEPGVLDATKCLSYWTQAPAAIPEPYRAELGDSVYGCDICQDVCPWNRGVEKRRAGSSLASNRRRRYRSRTGSSETGKSSSPNSIVSTSRATILAGCDETRSLLQATREAASSFRPSQPYVESDDPDAARRGRVGARADRSAIRMTQADEERLAVLVHEVRSPVAALRAIAETCQRQPARTCRASAARRPRDRGVPRDRASGPRRDGLIRPTGTGRHRPSRRGSGGSGGARRRERSRGDRRRPAVCSEPIPSGYGRRSTTSSRTRSDTPVPRRRCSCARDERALPSWSRWPTRDPGFPLTQQERIFEPGVRLDDRAPRIRARTRGDARDRRGARGNADGRVGARAKAQRSRLRFPSPSLPGTASTRRLRSSFPVSSCSVTSIVTPSGSSLNPLVVAIRTGSPPAGS